MDEREAHTLARAALGDGDALEALVSGFHRAVWRRLTAVRAILHAPQDRASDGIVHTARLLLATHTAERERAARALGAWLVTPPPSLASITEMAQSARRRLQCAIINAVAHDTSALSALIEALGQAQDAAWADTQLVPHWDALDDAVRDMLMDKATRHAWIARCAFEGLMRQSASRVSPDQQRALLHAIMQNEGESAALITMLAPHWQNVPAAVRDALVKTAACTPEAAMRAFEALLTAAPPQTHARTGWRERVWGTIAGASRDRWPLHAHWRALLHAIAIRPWTIGPLFASLAPHWNNLPRQMRDSALHIAARDAQAAKQALTTLWSVQGALSDAQRRMLLRASAHNACVSAALIAALAPCWDSLAPDVQDTLLQAATRDPWAARQAFVALLPSILSGTEQTRIGEHAVTDRAPHELLMAVATNTDETVALIIALAPCWDSLAPDVQDTLLQAAARDPWAARQAFSALGVGFDAQRRILLRAAARSPHESAAVIAMLAPHWMDAPRDVRTILWEASRTDLDAHLHAFAALAPVPGAITDEERQCVLQDVMRVPWKSQIVIEVLAARWMDAPHDVRTALLHIAQHDSAAARTALAALLPHGMITADQRRALAATVAQSPLDSALLIAAMCAAPVDQRRPGDEMHAPARIAAGCALTLWDILDAHEQDALCAAAAKEPFTAHQALVALLPHRSQRAHVTALASRVFPATVWTALDAACAHAPPAARDALARSIITYALDRERMPSVRRSGGAGGEDGVAAAWRMLDESAQAAFVRALALDADLVLAFGTLVAETDIALPLAEMARRILARAILPPAQALAALPHAPDASVIAAWLPVDPPDDAERAAWRQALEAGLLPLQVAAALAPQTAPPARRTRPRRTAQ